MTEQDLAALMGDDSPMHYAEASLEVDGGDDSGRVTGMAVPYNVAAHFPTSPVPIMIRPGAATESLIRRARNPERGIVLLAAHDDTVTLGDLESGSLEFFEDPDGKGLRYRAQLDLEDPDGLAAWRKVKTGRWRAASIGFSILKGRRQKVVDNSPEAKSDEKVPMIVATVIDVPELSLLAKGAFVGATALAAAFKGRSGDGMRFEVDGTWYEATPVADDAEHDASADAADIVTDDVGEDATLGGDSPGGLTHNELRERMLAAGIKP